MEELVERQSFLSKLADRFMRGEETYEDSYEDDASPQLRIHQPNRYHITVRRQIVSFQDAVASADGLKRGEQQVLNLTMCQPDLREKIKDFLCGVNYAAEGSWEELGDNIFLLAPATAYVEVSSDPDRVQPARN
jgi:cell division inhibitor SepF